ncbi:hypothetical protein Droror1_Dr00021158 [Drosera rotundifolia]
MLLLSSRKRNSRNQASATVDSTEHSRPIYDGGGLRIPESVPKIVGCILRALIEMDKRRHCLLSVERYMLAIRQDAYQPGRGEEKLTTGSGASSCLHIIHGTPV